MQSGSRSRKLSRSSSAKNSFKSASILEHGGMPPSNDEEEEIELVFRESQPPEFSRDPESPRTGSSLARGECVPSAILGSLPPTSATSDPAALGGESAGTDANVRREDPPHTRIALKTDQPRERSTQSVPMNYKQKYPEDPIYKETDPDARVFLVYNDESQIFDNEIILESGGSLDMLLVFAGLFASVLTTFVAQTSQSLSPDQGVISNSLLREMVSLQRAAENGTSFVVVPAADTSFTASPNDIWVNSLWFVSLALSLSTALLAVIAKQWLRQYSSFISGTPRERALIRQFRYDGLEKWGVRLIIGLLPTILHVSLFLFMVGLVVFLVPLDNTLAAIVAGITGFVCATYTITNILPILFTQCPYRTPLSEILNPVYEAVKFITKALCLFVVVPWGVVIVLLKHKNVVDDIGDWVPDWGLDWKKFFGGWPKSLKEVERARAHEEDKWGRPLGIAGALIWLAQTTSDASAKAIVAEAVGSVSHPSLRSKWVDDALKQQWAHISVRRGELLSKEDEGIAEHLMRGAWITNSYMAWQWYFPTGPTHCQTYGFMLLIAAYRRAPRLHTEDGKWYDLSPDLVFTFIASRDLSEELEAPVWMWWSLFTQTAGASENWVKHRNQTVAICTDGSTSEIDAHKEEWLKRVNIPPTLQHTIREKMIATYCASMNSPEPLSLSPDILAEISEFFVLRARKSKNPFPPFSTVSLATFLFDNFSQFPGFWMETEGFNSRIQS